MNDLPPPPPAPPCSAPLRAQLWWCTGLRSMLLVAPSPLLPYGSPARGQGGGCTRRYRCRIGLFFLRLAQGAFGDWNIICRAAQEGSGTQGKQRHLTSPQSLAPGLAFLCLPSACCRNPRLFGLQGKERHLQLGE